jgi:type IV secretory pathway component VirB8
MDFEDLFGEGQNEKKWRKPHERQSRDYYSQQDEDNYYDNDNRWFNRHEHKDDRESHRGPDKIQNILSMLQSHPHKKALLAGAVILGAILLIVCLLVIWAMFPLIMKGIFYVQKNGIQGIADFLLQSLAKIWKGNG